MNVSEYIEARYAWDAALSETAHRVLLKREASRPDDAAVLNHLGRAVIDALNSIVETPTSSLGEIADRATVLASLMGEEAWPEVWGGLAGRIAVDLLDITSPATASSGAEALTSATEAV